MAKKFTFDATGALTVSETVTQKDMQGNDVQALTVWTVPADQAKKQGAMFAGEMTAAEKAKLPK